MAGGNSAIRASDAERAEVADLLSKHYTDGRLDASELDERIERAMNAKTRGELSALLGDLPQPEPQPTVALPTHQPPPLLPLLLFPLFVLALVSAAASPHLPVFLLFLPVLWFWRRRRLHRVWASRSGLGASRAYDTWPGRVGPRG